MSPASRVSDTYRSWRGPETNPVEQRKRRRSLRWMVTLTVIAVVAFWIWYLLLPLFDPGVQMVYLPITDYEVLGAIPVPYAEEDIEGLKALDHILKSDRAVEGGGPRVLRDFQTAADLQGLVTVLQDAVGGSSDILLFYLRAQGISDDGQAYVLCADYDPSKPGTGRYPLKEVLRQIHACRAGTKLLILDAGQIDHDPRMGMIVNEFPRLLEQEAAAAEPGTWILCSHSALEYSHVHPGWKRSVFGYYVTEGLKGAADFDEDQRVNLDELFQFVSANVQHRVRRLTGASDSQTPMLLFTGRAEAARWPAPTSVLLPVQTKDIHDYVDVPENPDEAKDAAKKAKSLKGKAKAPKVPKVSFLPPPAIPARPRLTPLAKAALLQVPKSPGGDQQAAGDADPKGAKKEPAAGPAKTAPVQPADQGEAAAAKTEPPAAPEPAPAKAEKGKEAEAEAPPEDASEKELSRWLLGKAWNLRDGVQRRTAEARWSPVDYAPHLWREYEGLLAGYEKLYLAGKSTSPAELNEDLRNNLLQLEALLAEEASFASGDDLTIAQLVAVSRPRYLPQVTSPRSIGMGRLFVWPPTSDRIADLQRLESRYDDWTRQQFPKDFDKWLAGRSAEELQLWEIQTAARFGSALERTEWGLVQLAMEVRLLAENVAAYGEWCEPWLKEHVTEADQQLNSGEQELLRPVSPNPARASEQLLSARARLREARQIAQSVEQAILTRNDLAYRLPYYVKWYCRSGFHPTAEAPDPADLQQLIQRLQTQHTLLAGEDVSRIERLRENTAALRMAQGRIEQGLQPDFAQTLQNNPAQGTKPWQIQNLLSTPLLAASTRLELLDALASIESQPPQTWIRSPQDWRTSARLRLTDQNDWRQVGTRARLDLELALLIANELQADDRAAVLREKFDTAMEAVREFQATQEATYENSGSTAHKQLREQEAAVWKAYREFGSLLRDFYRELPLDVRTAVLHSEDMRDRSQRAAHKSTLQRLLVPMTLIDGRDARLLEQKGPFEPLRQAWLYDTLLWHHDRFLDARSQGVSRDLAAYLDRSADAYLEQAEAIPAQPRRGQANVAQAPLAIESPERFQLDRDEWKTLELFVSPVGGEPVTTWLVLQYNPAVLEIRPADSTTRLYHYHELAEDWKSTLPATLVLPPGSRRRVRIELRAKTTGDAPTPLEVWAHARELTLTHRVQVRLPSPDVADLRVAGSGHLWHRRDHGLVLYPYPNQEGEFALELVNLTEKPGRIELSGYVLPLVETPAGPQVVWPLDAEGRVRPDAPPLVTVVPPTELKLPTDGTAVPVPFGTPPANKEEEKPAEGAAATEEQGEAEKEPQEGPPVIDVTSGLVFVIRDLDRNRSVVKQVEIAPQRPRRYLVPQVSYDRLRQRVEVIVRPKDPRWLPPKGSRVHWDIGNQVPPDTSMQLEAEVKPPNFEARLFANVPPDPRRYVTVALNVDGYPRAFLYRVRCAASRENFPPEEDLQQIRIVSPEGGQGYQAPRETIPVVFEVDAPIDAFHNDNDLVEIGIDINRDRDLVGERTLKFYSDRQVSVKLTKMEPGKLTLQTSVSDYHLDLPAPSLRNARVALLGRLRIGEQVTWTEPVEILLDSATPSIKPPGLLQAQIKAPYPLRLLISDELSGVASAEVVVDLEKLGEFGKQKPVALEPISAGVWGAEIPPKGLTLGVHTLLVQARDHVGNTTKVLPLSLVVREESAAPPGVNKLTGTVVYGKDPVEGATVTVEGAEMEGKTDEQGRFTFTLAPGKYKVSAQAKIKNSNRVADAAVEVQPPPAPPTSVQLKLEFRP